MGCSRATFPSLLVGFLAALEGRESTAEPAAPQAETFVLRVAQQAAELRVVDDLRFEPVLREPAVANPLYLTFDERGRLWVVQYRQYPWPAGLKLLSRDSVWRNVYDPPFAPPPPHDAASPFRGRDRITIHEDADGDGVYERETTFLDGLNLATAALPGRGGVFVLNPPYLLFYADRDRDDRPDAPRPELLLSGFGFEDSHSLANSLRWGPDGWIYGAQGSTVSSAIVVHDADGRPQTATPPRHSMGQNIWRYHPERRIYEIYAEGGGNAFGVEIDACGRVFSGHNGGDTRGFHYVQGGYYRKTFGKHGQLSNRFAFDHHPAMAANPSQRFTHAFCFYEADHLPSRYRGAMVAINPVEHKILASRAAPHGSTFRTDDAGILVESGGGRGDWFIPVDIQLAPDGALYVADWHAEQADHKLGSAGRTNPELGRVYRLSGLDWQPHKPEDLGGLTTRELAERSLHDGNRWRRMQALRLLGDRRDASLAPWLRERLAAATDSEALHALWALHLSAGLTADDFAAGLRRPQPHVRRWTLHLLGDQPAASGPLAARLCDLARSEADPEVRCQLAASCQRLPAEVAVPVLEAMLSRSADADDPLLPRTVWWSIEAHADHEALRTALVENPALWQTALEVGGWSIPQNLIRRHALRGRESDLQRCGELLRVAPTPADRTELVAAFASAYAGRGLPALPWELAEELARDGGPYALLLAVRGGHADAYPAALEVVARGDAPVEQRLSLIDALGSVRAAPDETPPHLVALLQAPEVPAIRRAALAALQHFARAEIAPQILARWDALDDDLRDQAVGVLASRGPWAETLLDAVASGRVAPGLVDQDARRRMRQVAAARGPALDALLPLAAAATSDAEQRLEQLAAMIRAGEGSAVRGRDVFHRAGQCGKCHRLYEQGGEIGPDLTAYNRGHLARMLRAVVQPAAEIREGYESYVAVTADGRVLSGFKVEETSTALLLRGADGILQSLPREEIEHLAASDQSLMPEGLLDGLSDEQIRDLFAFLASTTPPL